jgi:hypothetical protein
MLAKATAALQLALAAHVAFAQSMSPMQPRTVKFNDEEVTLRWSSAPFDEELRRLWDATNDAESTVEQERLWRIRWEDYGEAVALQSLAIYHLERGDLVSAYAHLYAVDRIAKWVESVAATRPGPIVRRHLDDIEADMNLVGKKLTAEQRTTGVQLAAAMIRNNANCCRWP